MTRPLIPTKVTVQTEFGAVTEDLEELMSVQGAQGDLTYVAGYSDMRRDADYARAQGKKADPLPVQLRWVRRSRVNGQPTTERTTIVTNRGYTAVPWKEIGTHDWLKEAPAGAMKLPDGSIGREDMVLMVCPQEQAAKNAARKVLKWKERSVENMETAFTKMGERFEGSNPEVTIERGTPER